MAFLPCGIGQQDKNPYINKETEHSAIHNAPLRDTKESQKLLYACLPGPRAGIREPLNLKSNRYEKEKLHAADCRGAQTERRKRIRRFHAARNRRLGQ